MSETERLIELVKSRRFLYDLSDPLYKDRHKRMEAWKEISRLMGSGSGTAHIWSAKWKGLKDNYAKYKKTSEPAHIWSAKWKGLKDNYAKYKKTSEPGFVEAYKKYKHWPWADKVKFLDDCVSTTCRRVYNYTPKEIREPSPENTDPKTSEDNLNEGTSECEVKKDSLDGVDHFFLSYAETFKKLPPRMQIMLKLEIATLFTRYELQAEGMSKESIENMPRIVPHPTVDTGLIYELPRTYYIDINSLSIRKSLVDRYKWFGTTQFWEESIQKA
ncbi:hypothetical protein SFRURICE_003383, partial [Spodoptera frugiperda]